VKHRAKPRKMKTTFYFYIYKVPVLPVPATSAGFLEDKKKGGGGGRFICAGVRQTQKDGEEDAAILPHKRWHLLPPFFFNEPGSDILFPFLLNNAVLWIRNYFFGIRIPFSSEFWDLDLAPDPGYLKKSSRSNSVSDPKLHSFTMPTILNVFFTAFYSILFNKNIRLM
jgi:hypothetical protein